MWAQPTGYQEYYVLGYEEHVWRAFLAINDGSDYQIEAGQICSTVSLVATADYQVIYYDHWEDGYEADLLNPTQATTVVYGDGNVENGGSGDDILHAGDAIDFLSTQNVTGPDALNGYVPVNPYRNPTDLRYDGGDRIITSGGPVNLTHAMWPLDNSWVGGAWEVPSRQTYATATSYRIPIGSDLYTFGGGDTGTYGDFRNVYLQLSAFEDNTTVSIRQPSGEAINFTLDRGETYSSMGYINSMTAPAIEITVGTTVRASKPTQAGLITGADGSFQGRFLTILPDQLWGADYVIPAPSGASGQEAEIYLANPNDFEITITARDRFTQTTFSISPTTYISATIPYGPKRGGLLPAGSATRFTSPDGRFGVIVCANSSYANYDWGFAGMPAQYLSRDYYIPWAPGSYNTPPTENGSPVWVTPLRDQTTFYVDFYRPSVGLDGVVDESFTLDVLEQRRIFDPDNDNTGMHIWASGEFATAWGPDPLTAEPSVPYLDLGVGGLPVHHQWLELVLQLEKTAEPTVLPPSGGTVTFTLVAQTEDAAVVGVNISDTLPISWQYVPSSTIVTYPDHHITTLEPMIEGQELGWNLSASLAPYQALTLTYQARVTTTGSVGTTVEDGFESQTYDGGRGWSAPWIESGENDGPAAGGVVITAANPYLGDVHLDIAAPTRSLSRTVDLSGFTWPQLHLMRYLTLGGSGAYFLDVFDGLQWRTVTTWTVESGTGSYLQEAVDLRPYLSAKTAIRFRSDDQVSTGDHLRIDQIEISDAIVMAVNHGEAIGRLQYTDAIFNPTDEAVVYVSPLLLSKTVNQQEAGIGEQLIYTLTYTNVHPSSTITNVAIQDTVPIQYVTFQSASDGGVYDSASGSVLWTVGDLSPHSGGVVTLSVTVNDFVADGTIIENQAQVTGDGSPLASSNIAATLIRAPRVVLEKSGPTVARQGETITYTLSYVNAGLASAEDVVIRDTLPVSVTYVTGSLAIDTGGGWIPLSDVPGDDEGAYISSTLIITPGVVPPQGNGRIRFRVTITEGLPAGTLIENWAVLDHRLDIPRASNLMVTRIADLLIAKTAHTIVETPSPPVVAPNGYITYTLSYRNASPAVTQTNVILQEAIPAYTHFVTATGVFLYSWDHGATWSATQPITPPTHIRWLDPLLPPATSRVVSLTVQANDTLPDGSVIQNIAHITSTQTGAYLHEWIPSNDVEVKTALLWAQKSALPTTAWTGGQISYTIHYGNRGSADVVAILSDALPTNTTYVARSIWGQGASTATLPTLRWDVGTLVGGGEGGTRMVGYAVRLPFDMADGTTITNTAYISSVYGLQISDPAVVTVRAAADLALTKQATENVETGGTITYTLVYTNRGPSYAHDVAITDTLPSGTTFGHVLTSGWATPTVISADNIQVVWFTPTLPTSASGSIRFTVDVGDVDGQALPDGDLVNRAVITARTPDPLPGNEEATASTRILTSTLMHIQGWVFQDLDGDGLYDAPPAGNETGIPGTLITLDEAFTTTTDLSGHYLFTTSVPGFHQVVETDSSYLAASARPSTPASITDLPAFFSTTANRVQVHLAPGEYRRVDFGDAPSTVHFATLYGIVFTDGNGDGQQGRDEGGIEGVNVTLGISPTTVVTTDLYGRYTISTALSGVQIISETNPPGFFSSTPDQAHVMPFWGRGYQVDFGDVPNGENFADIHGYVFADDNANGVFDADEVGIGYVALTMGLTKSVISDQYGRYVFSTTMTTISHTIIETDPPGYVSTTPNRVVVTVTPGQSRRADFGDTSIAPCAPDIYEEDDSVLLASPIVADSPQAHQFCDDATDWVRFQAQTLQVYTVTAMAVSWQTQAHPILIMYDNDGQTPLAWGEELSGTLGAGAVIVWQCPETGEYPVLVRNRDDVAGQHTDYHLRLQAGPPPKKFYLPIILRTAAFTVPIDGANAY